VLGGEVTSHKKHKSEGPKRKTATSCATGKRGEERGKKGKLRGKKKVNVTRFFS